MEAPEIIQKMADHLGGVIDEISGPLPDGSGFACVSFPLPKDHWLLINPEQFNVPPMPVRMGEGQRLVLDLQVITKKQFEKMLQAAGRYAVRATTDCDKIKDFDPDAMVCNFINGVVGYCTENGLSSDDWANPPDQNPLINVQINKVT